MKNFRSFINKNLEKGMLYIEVDESQYIDDWKMTIDISKIWKDYINDYISILDFNNQYANLLMEHQEQIIETIGEFCWNEIEPIVSDELKMATTEEESMVIYNKLYDIFDNYEIKIECGENVDENEELDF